MEQCGTVTDNQHRASQFREIVSAEFREETGNGFAAGADQLRNFFMSHSQPDTHRSVGGLAGIRSIEQDLANLSETECDNPMLRTTP